MKSEEAAKLWRDLADGRIVLRDLGGLSRTDILQIAVLAKAAMDVGRTEQAADTFGFAYELAQDCPEYLLYKAFAEAEFNPTRALATIDTYFQHEVLPTEDVIRALLLKARLQHQTAPEEAKGSYLAAEHLSAEGPKERAAFLEMGR